MKILFVCKSNAGRSQIAEAFFYQLSPEHEVNSAGVGVPTENVGQSIFQITDKVINTMNDVRIDISNKVMKPLTPELVDSADKVVSLESRECLPDYLAGSTKLEMWDVSGVQGDGQEFFNNLRDLIKNKVNDFILRLSNSSSNIIHHRQGGAS